MGNLRTTRYWGVGACVGLALPLIALVRPVEGQSVPQPPQYESLWQQSFDASLPVQLTVSGDTVVVSGPSSPATGRSATTGEVRWTSDVVASQPPIGAEGLVVVPSGGQLVVLDAATGATRWTADLGAAAAASPGWVNGGLVVPTEVGVEAFRTDGTPVWTVPLAGIRTAPVIDAGVTFVGTADALVALTLADGTERWRRALPGTPLAITAADRSLFLGVSDGSWVAYPQTGARALWRDRTRVSVIGRPMVGEQHIYVAFFDNTIKAFDRQSGNLRWFGPLDERPGAPPALLGNVIVVAAENGDLFELPIDEAERRSRRVFEMPESVTSPGLEAVALSGDGGQVYVLVSSLDDPGFHLVALRRSAAGS